MINENLVKSIAGLGTLMSCVLSLVLIAEHFTTFRQPSKQKLIIYIILMVPLFSIDSFVSILELKSSEWIISLLDSIKECYEAFVIYSFLKLMYSYMDVSTTKEVPKKLLDRHIHHTFPFNFFMKDMKMDKMTLQKLQNWTTQFVYIRPVLSILSIFLEIYFENWYNILYVPLNIILNISVTMAVYSLMLFYHAFAEDLKEHHPLAQFLCIKGVVFFAFWQGIILEILVYFQIIRSEHWYNANQISYAIQNLLVCIEMGFIFTFAHMYAFSAKEFKEKRKQN